ncbi:flagellar motor switch protein FliM [Planobispora rosea]|uniref:Flagellar motor switch protein FliM n=1 Tax=Planobispora rosea TaxID=35762 RepID=A0A8J3WHY1_PLARO|nr:flagellar motor switch protein FliM [Planobispora rosea]GIH88306.1 flagellar motor switch protein FliM [Planobispora rosea]
MGVLVSQTQPFAPTHRLLGRVSRRAKNSEPHTYDFRRPIKLSREHTRTLQIAYETFARQYTTLLTSTLRVVSQVSLVSIQQLTYDEYISGLANPTIVATLTLDPLPGAAIMEFSLSTAMASIDHMLGGPGGPQIERPLTDMELPLLRDLLNRVLDEMHYAFESITDFRPMLGAVDYNPQFVQAAAPADAVIVASFEMHVGSEECIMTFCLPFTSIFPKLQVNDNDVTLSDSQRRTREEAHRNMVAALGTTPIEVSVRFDSVELRPEQIVRLEPGDVVPLTHAVTAPLAVTAADITFAHAVPGSQGPRLACLVVPTPQNETENQ